MTGQIHGFFINGSGNGGINFFSHSKFNQFFNRHETGISGFGGLVLIKHADGWVTAYAHNDALSVGRGDRVTKGQVIVVVEAMKTQQPFVAPFDGTVTSVKVDKNDQVADGQVLAVVEPAK